MSEALPVSFSVRTEPLPKNTPAYHDAAWALSTQLAEKYLYKFPPGTKFRILADFEVTEDGFDVAILTATTDLTCDGVVVTSPAVRPS